jgi:hypothetical protein
VAVSGHGDTPDKINDLSMSGQSRLNGKLSACAVSLGAAPGELVARQIAVFITGHALITAGKGCRAQVMLTGGPGLRWR